MNINQFSNPVEENIDDSLDHLDEQILTKYDKDIEAESDEEDKVYIRISHNKALIALSKFRFCKEQQVEDRWASLEALTLQERHIKQRQVLEHRQNDIRSYFVADSL
jgi:hypothetical protein